MENNILIFDPATHIPGLKTLFPTSSYYAIDPEDYPCFRYETTIHLNKQDFYNLYNFQYSTGIENIKNHSGKILFLTLPLLDCVRGSKWTKPYGLRLLDLIRTIVKDNKWKKIILFDTYDYDYDPSKLDLGFEVNYFFKRNYNKNKIYNKNVIPFPFQMFVLPCVLHYICTSNINTYEDDNNNKVNKILWGGNLYNHIDNDFNVFRLRLNMYEQIKNFVYTLGYTKPEEYHKKIREFKICLDLHGVGDPNKRTFEILLNNSLLFTMVKDLNWGFLDGETFEPETIFENKEDFLIKANKLLNDQEVYERCKNTQLKIVKKYFNVEYLKKYIIKNIEETL